MHAEYRPSMVRWPLSGARINTHILPVDPAVATSAEHALPPTLSSRELLRAALPSTAALLYRRRASLVGDDVIERYVALHWLEWNGGALRLTVTGQNICDHLKAESRATSGQ